MHDLEKVQGDKQILLDGIVTLAQGAAQKIERLKQGNEQLIAEIAALRKEAVRQQSEADRRQRRLAEMEQAVVAANRAMVWSQWFEQTYGNSIFYMDMQRSFLKEQAAAEPAPIRVQTEEV